ncbi:hypothetical protein CKO28_04605 [Rhodovibrio sodomensis]|uniref:Uncharacterized protein n=1 Tax=Rhodovibrio sodomensis TaxID=1088 RepID=A0ABS1DA53_9PROT|nr:hypothetical protein [Rhodovibrio sodomensis]MBK1667314.1 hypothetical protein [Rhodovibrio sodomensis]
MSEDLYERPGPFSGNHEVPVRGGGLQLPVEVADRLEGMLLVWLHHARPALIGANESFPWQIAGDLEDLAEDGEPEPIMSLFANSEVCALRAGGWVDFPTYLLDHAGISIAAAIIGRGATIEIRPPG